MNSGNMKDYYYILGLPKNASKDEIKTAYRKLSTKFHPDKNSGDKFFEERFIDIQEAYETLSDDVKRKLYDDKLKVNDPADSSQGFGAANAAASSSFSTTERKRKIGKTGGVLAGLIVFGAIAVKIFVPILYKKDVSANYSSPKDTVKNTSTDDSVILLRMYYDTPVSTVSNVPDKDLPDAGAPVPKNADENNQALKFEDDDGLAAEDVINNFFNSFNNNDCHKAWGMTYNEYWVKQGDGWFCSSAAFGGDRKILVRNMSRVVQNDAEADIYVEYYAEDIYNGNKCFKQTIIVQKIQCTDNKSRWKITKMKNNEPPVTCNE